MYSSSTLNFSAEQFVSGNLFNSKHTTILNLFQEPFPRHLMLFLMLLYNETENAKDPEVQYIMMLLLVENQRKSIHVKSVKRAFSLFT